MAKIEGVLKVISKNGGIILEGNENWINPNPQAKIDILDRLDAAKASLIGNVVSVTTDEKQQWSAIELIKKVEKLINPSPKHESDSTLRSVSLSYAKDLACAEVITVESIIDHAEKFYTYLRGQ